MNRKQKRMVRLLAIVLAVLLGAGAVISAVLSFAYAEEAVPFEPVTCELTMEYLGEEQALRMSQRLVYTNTSSKALDRVVFYAPANLFRRQSSLVYEAEQLQAAFPTGYLPGGVDLISVTVDDEDADWGYQGTDEAFLRVACSLEPDSSCVFLFNYYLLLTENAAFLGISENDWRLSAFYFVPASLDENGEFMLNAPLSFTRWIDAPAMDFESRILLPKEYTAAATGEETHEILEGSAVQWNFRADNARDFSLVFSLENKEYTAETPSGIGVRCLTTMGKSGREILSTALEAIEICEAWLGEFPFRQIDLIEADHGPGPLNHSACMWIPKSLLKEGGHKLQHAVRTFIAAQYFECSAWSAPVSDAWLHDAISEYLAYLMQEDADGYDAYIASLNKNIVDSLQLTIPGGLNVASDASLFTANEYDIVIRDRGAAVFHELYTAMGKDDLIAGLRLFWKKGLEEDVLTEMDLVNALDEASGKHWEKFLTDWIFNIGDYVNQDIYWLE